MHYVRFLSLWAALLVGLATTCIAQSALIITEIDYDQPGVDQAEWVEITNLNDAEYFIHEIDLVLYTTIPSVGGICVEVCRVDLSSLVFIPAGSSVVLGEHPCATLPLCASENAIPNSTPSAVVLESNGVEIDSVEYGSSLNPSVCPLVSRVTTAVDSDSEPGSLRRPCLFWGFESITNPCAMNPCTPTDVGDSSTPIEAPWGAMKVLYQ